jgi:hypothetical protein
MDTITIPRDMVKRDDLVIIPRKEYEEFLEIRKAITVFQPTLSDKRELKGARQEMRKGNYLTIQQLKNELDIKD